MKWTPWLFGSLAAALIAGCGGGKRNDTGTAGGAGAETGTMQGGATGTATDTSMRATDTTGGISSDTARAGSRMRTDTNSSGARKSRAKGVAK